MDNDRAKVLWRGLLLDIVGVAALVAAIIHGPIDHAWTEATFLLVLAFGLAHEADNLYAREGARRANLRR